MSARALRAEVAVRDGWGCHYCGTVLDLGCSTLEHIVPRCRRGLTTPLNLVLACASCNRVMGSQLAKCWCNRCRSARLHHWAHHGLALPGLGNAEPLSA